MEVYALKVRPKGHIFPILSWGIMIFQGMNPFSKKAWSHNAIMFKSKIHKEFFVIDSTSSGVTVKPEELFFENYKLVGSKKLTAPEKLIDFEHWLFNILGREYDTVQLLGIALKVIGVFSFNKLGSNYKKMTCNEVILNYLEKINGFKIGDPDNFDLRMTWSIIP